MIPKRSVYYSEAQLRQVAETVLAFVPSPSASPELLDILAALAAHSPSVVPVGLEATLSLLSALQLPSVSPGTAVLHREVRRLALSMALTRFVNSVLDPLQQGYFAKSLAGLAKEIGLPSEFVALRHRATHEELDSEHSLEQAAEQAFEWLKARYWYPLLVLTANPDPFAAGGLSALESPTLTPNLLAYKALYKRVTRDETLLETAAQNGSAPLVDEKDRIFAALALEDRKQLARKLVREDGWLVPLAKRKRPSPVSSRDVSAAALLPAPLLNLWAPLINHLCTRTAFSTGSRAAFKKHLEEALVTSILLPVSTSQADAEDESVSESAQRTRRAWLCWLLFEYEAPRSTTEDDDEELEDDRAAEISAVVRTLLTAAVAAATPPTTASGIIALLELISGCLRGASDTSYESITDRIEPLLKPLKRASAPPRVSSSKENSVEDVVGAMERKLKEAREAVARAKVARASRGNSPAADDMVVDGVEERGKNAWVRVKRSEWAPCPIGWIPTEDGAPADSLVDLRLSSLVLP